MGVLPHRRQFSQSARVIQGLACRLFSQRFSTSNLLAMAQQQGQNFSQLKDAKDEQTEVVFNPHEQVDSLLLQQGNTFQQF